MATQAEIEAAKERHCRVVAGERVTDVYARPDGVFSDHEHFEIANGMHSTDCKILANELVSQQSQPIDETTVMPAFVGDDEIEIAGVAYVRQVSQQQPVNERLLECVQELFAEFREYLPDTLKKVVSQAISAAEAEIDERKLPVTEKWLQSRSWDHCGTRGQCNIYSPSIDVESIRIEFGLKVTMLFDSLCKISPTRGDVMIVDDLLRVIGGAK